jgi:hypothetical protein
MTQQHRIKTVLTLAAVAFAFTATSVKAELWTPAEIGTSLWLDAADASTVTHVGDVPLIVKPDDGLLGKYTTAGMG